MKNPEIPKERAEPSRDTLKDLQISPEATKERDQMANVLADSRDKRFDLVRAMKREGNVKQRDLWNLEMILTT